MFRSNFFGGRQLHIAACKQYGTDSQTRACVGQRFVRIRQLAGQRSVRMGQHSCAKDLQTRPWANRQCERGQGWHLNVWHASAASRHAVSKLKERFSPRFHMPLDFVVNGSPHMVRAEPPSTLRPFGLPHNSVECGIRNKSTSCQHATGTAPFAL